MVSKSYSIKKKVLHHNVHVTTPPPTDWGGVATRPGVVLKPYHTRDIVNLELGLDPARGGGGGGGGGGT